MIAYKVFLAWTILVIVFNFGCVWKETEKDWAFLIGRVDVEVCAEKGRRGWLETEVQAGVTMLRMWWTIDVTDVVK